MSNTISANISYKAAVRLLIMNELEVNSYWNTAQAEGILNELQSMEIKELLRIIDFIEPLECVPSATLPQFGSLETLIKVPEILVQTGVDGLSHTQIGFYLKQDITAKQGANMKFGETHGKGAYQLGLVGYADKKVHFGAMTNAFCAIDNKEQQLEIAKRLCFRIPIIQTLLHKAKVERTNGFDLMKHLEKTTQKRRAVCAKMVIKELHTLNNAELTKRLENVFWDMGEAV